MKVTLPLGATVGQAARLIRERRGSFPECQSWPEVQRACAALGVEILPARDERGSEGEP